MPSDYPDPSDVAGSFVRFVSFVHLGVSGRQAGPFVAKPGNHAPSCRRLVVSS
jgi:hypothetical protein